MALSEEQREAMIQGIVGLRRVRELLPGNTDVDRGLEGIRAALGEAVSQRTAAKALGLTHPELSKLISARELVVLDTSRGRSQVEVASLVEYIESNDVAAPTPPAWKQRRAEREAAGEDAEAESQQEALARIMKMRALAFHRSIARNLDAEMVEAAREGLAAMREADRITSQQAESWAAVLERPVSDIAARMTDYSPAGDALREVSPFNKH